MACCLRPLPNWRRMQTCQTSQRGCFSRQSPLPSLECLPRSRSCHRHCSLRSCSQLLSHCCCSSAGAWACPLLSHLTQPMRRRRNRLHCSLQSGKTAKAFGVPAGRIDRVSFIGLFKPSSSLQNKYHGQRERTHFLSNDALCWSREGRHGRGLKLVRAVVGEKNRGCDLGQRLVDLEGVA